MSESSILTSGPSVHAHVVATVAPITSAAERAASAARVAALLAARKAVRGQS